MDEIELLKEYLRLSKTSCDLDMHIKFWDEGAEKEHFRNEKVKCSESIERLKTQLRDFPNKEFSTEAKSTIIDQLNAYIKEVSKGNYGLKLSRNQSTVIKNMLFSNILKDVKNLITDKIFGYSIPAYLVYTYDESDSIEISDLIEFLRNEIVLIQAIDNPDYIKLEDYYKELYNRIITRFISENHN